eukprot:6224204-Amphidinium_carterae.1
MNFCTVVYHKRTKLFELDLWKPSVEPTSTFFFVLAPGAEGRFLTLRDWSATWLLAEASKKLPRTVLEHGLLQAACDGP